MEDFIKWVDINWLTIASIVLSGLISLIVSGYYHNKGNRNNLQMTMLFPILRILDSANSSENYNILCGLSDSYCSRYLTKKERTSLVKVISAYEKIIGYDQDSVKADSLCRYFEVIAKENGVKVKIDPIYDGEGELIGYNHPEEFYYMRNDLEAIVKRFDINYEYEECENHIISIFSSLCRNVYKHNEKIDYFNDCGLNHIFDNSNVQKKRNIKFDELKEVKDEFSSLKIIKELRSW